MLFVPGLVDLSSGAMMDLLEVLLADCLGWVPVAFPLWVVLFMLFFTLNFFHMCHYIYIYISHLSSWGAKVSFMSMSTFLLKRGSSKSRNNCWLNELLLGGFLVTNWLASISMNRLPIHGAPPPQNKPKNGPVYPSTRKKVDPFFLPIAFSHWLSWFSSPLVPHFHEHRYLIYTIY
jgi:hypothetical protein